MNKEKQISNNEVFLFHHSKFLACLPLKQVK